MNNELLDELYSKFPMLNYWNELSNISGTEIETFWELNNNIPRGNRESFYAFVLWDKLFYGENQEKYPYKDAVFYGRSKQDKAQRIKNVQELLKNAQIRPYLDDVISHWNIFRDQLFQVEIEELDKCEKPSDYDAFLNRHPETYGELILRARYHKSVLEHKPFDGYSELVRRFPNSELVSKLKDKIKICNGIQYMMSDEVCKNELLKSSLHHFMEGFQGPYSTDGLTRAKKIYIQDTPVLLSLWYAILDNYKIEDKEIELFVYANSKSSNKAVVASYYLFEKIISKMNEMLALNMSIPTMEQWMCIKTEGSLNKYKSTNPTMGVNRREWLFDTSEDMAQIVDADTFFEKPKLHEPMVHRINKSRYAECRIVIEQ